MRTSAPAGKRRKAKPRTPVNDSGDDIDFYSEGVRA
jgi:hypothetical protein